jgi:prepilin-type N-terminal cleavage/methylation domain-containing protein
MKHAMQPTGTEPFGVGRRIHGEARPAFTLVELMVVIVIIGLITAVAVPVVMQALTKARNAAIKAEIDMLHMAIMNYKNEYGSFPPCFDSATPPYYASGNPASKHLARLFPRCANPTATGVNAQFAAATQPITPLTAMVSWLGGYTADPTLPLTSGTRKRLFDFDQARISATLGYAPSGKPNSPYIYIDSSRYFDTATSTIPTFPFGGNTYFAHRVPTSATGPFNTLTQPAFNPDTFQILCAGRDEAFGTDDDLSNFWPGTRKEYLESL